VSELRKDRLVRSQLEQVSRQIDAMLAAEELPAGLVHPGLAEAVMAYPSHGGKRMRPALVFWCCGLVGGDPDRVRYAALAVELYHNWTLVHDDIIDRDATRRGRSTCHCMAARSAAELFPGEPEAAAEYGKGLAMLAGDVQQSWAVNALLRTVRDGVSPQVALVLVERLTGMVTPALISGEALDMEYARRRDVGLAALEEMLTLKTAVLLDFAAVAGVLVGLDCADPDRPEARAAGAFARAAGLAFQLRDDFLGVFGDETALGKPVGSDACEGKLTPLFLTAWERADAAMRRELLDLWGRADLDRDGLQAVRQVIRTTGADQWLQARAAGLVDQALGFLAGFPEGPYRQWLEQWARFALERTH